MVPSSAKVPCMIGKAKSRGWKEPSASWSPGRAGSATRWTAGAGVASSPSRSAASRSAGRSQRPSRVMPTGTTLVLAVEHRRDEARGGEGDLVLGGAAAEDEGQLKHDGKPSRGPEARKRSAEARRTPHGRLAPP